MVGRVREPGICVPAWDGGYLLPAPKENRLQFSQMFGTNERGKGKA